MLRNEVDAGVKSCQLALDTMLRVLRDPDKVERSDHYQVAVLATELAATQKIARFVLGRLTPRGGQSERLQPGRASLCGLLMSRSGLGPNPESIEPTFRAAPVDGDILVFEISVLCQTLAEWLEENPDWAKGAHGQFTAEPPSGSAYETTGIHHASGWCGCCMTARCALAANGSDAALRYRNRTCRG
jgi:hypothetical protein